MQQQKTNAVQVQTGYFSINIDKPSFAKMLLSTLKGALLNRTRQLTKKAT
ncbi:hypothetical protein AAFM48_09105 [Burkholderia pseudomallei]